MREWDGVEGLGWRDGFVMELDSGLDSGNGMVFCAWDGTITAGMTLRMGWVLWAGSRSFVSEAEFRHVHGTGT